MRRRYAGPALDEQIRDLEQIKEWLHAASLKDGPYSVAFKKYHDIACRMKYTIEALRRLERLEAALLEIAENVAPPD